MKDKEFDLMTRAIREISQRPDFAQATANISIQAFSEEFAVPFEQAREMLERWQLRQVQMMREAFPEFVAMYAPSDGP